MSRPSLADARIVLTRQPEDDAALANRLQEAGARTFSFPALELQARDGPSPRGPFDWAVFTSPAAVRYGLERVQAILPARVAAPGKGTADRLRAAGVGCVFAPRRGAGLAALLDMAQVRDNLPGTRVLWVGGRPRNRRAVAQLRACGAQVAPFDAYERRAVTRMEPFVEWLRGGAVDAIMVSSVAAVEALAALVRHSGCNVDPIAWIASSPRVAAAVRASGGQVGVVADGADSGSLVAAAGRWWGSRQV